MSHAATGNTKTRTAELADGVLARRALLGDQQAFEGLVQRYRRPLFRYIYNFLGDYDQACDVLQHVFIRLYTSLPSLGTEKPLKGWLFRIAHNRCVDELRRRKYAVHFLELESADDDEEMAALASLPDPNPLPEEIAERRELQRDLRQAIEALPLQYRAVVLLRYARHLSFPEIARALNVPESTAKTNFHRARPLLRATLLKQMRVSSYREIQKEWGALQE